MEENQGRLKPREIHMKGKDLVEKNRERDKFSVPTSSDSDCLLHIDITDGRCPLDELSLFHSDPRQDFEPDYEKHVMQKEY